MALLPKRMLASAALVTGSSAGIIFLMLRNIFLARTMLPELFGVAAAIQTISAAADMLSDMGWDKYLIQSNVTDRLASQSVVHFLRLATGAVVSLIIIITAPLIAHAIKVPAATGAIAMVSIVVMLRCAAHTDYKFRQREMNFKGEPAVELSRCCADLIVAIAAGLLLKSYWAMTWALIANGAIQCLVTHLLADQPYRPRWENILGKKVYDFGLPLLFNNIVNYIAGQGDRLLVGIAYSPRILATYANSLTLIAGPQAVIGRVMVTLAFPILSRSRTTPALFAKHHRQLGMVAICAAACISFPVIAFGSDMVRLLFGKVYHPDPALIAAIVIPQSINVIRMWTISSLMAHAKTKVIPLVNLTRIIGFLLATVLAFQHFSLISVAYSLLLGEAICLVAQLVVHRRLVAKEARRIIIMLTLLAALWLLVTVFQPSATSFGLKFLLAFMPTGLICLLAAVFEFMPHRFIPAKP